jgi:hypothetical protein
MVKQPPLLDASDCTDRGAAIAAAAGGGQPYVELANPGRRNLVDEREPRDPGRPAPQGKQPPAGYAYKDRRSRERPVLTASTVALSGKAARSNPVINSGFR